MKGKIQPSKLKHSWWLWKPEASFLWPPDTFSKGSPVLLKFSCHLCQRCLEVFDIPERLRSHLLCSACLEHNTSNNAVYFACMPQTPWHSLKQSGSYILATLLCCVAKYPWTFPHYPAYTFSSANEGQKSLRHPHGAPQVDICHLLVVV